MPIICENKEENKIKLKTEISQTTFDEIQQYMQWAELEDLNFFIEEAVKYVFKNDRDWKKYKKTKL